MRKGLIAWQWSIYPAAHQDRRNLLIHLFTMPLFLAGLLAVPSGIWLHRWITSALGIGSMMLVVIAQGIGHRLEKNPPAKIEGAMDGVLRIFAEQLINFPRFVASGELVRVWGSPNHRREATPKDPPP